MKTKFRIATEIAGPGSVSDDEFDAVEPGLGFTERINCIARVTRVHELRENMK